MYYTVIYSTWQEAVWLGPWPKKEEKEKEKKRGGGGCGGRGGDQQVYIYIERERWGGGGVIAGLGMRAVTLFSVYKGLTDVHRDSRRRHLLLPPPPPPPFFFLFFFFSLSFCFSCEDGEGGGERGDTNLRMIHSKGNKKHVQGLLRPNCPHTLENFLFIHPRSC